MAISGDTDADVSYNLDYRSKKDDAWYTSAVVLEDGKQLRVKFRDFMDSYYDEIFSIADFSTKSDLQEFIRRFRRVSVPIEDNECSRVIADMVVCATYKGDGSVRFFDAIVDAVFLFSQLRCITKSICLRSVYAPIYWSGSMVTGFAKLVKEKLGLVYKRPFLSRKTSPNETLDELQDLESAGYSSYGGPSEGRGRFYPQLSDHDRDLGGVKETACHHYIILENLEKDLSPNSMMEFMHVQTAITPHHTTGISFSNVVSKNICKRSSCGG
ncbi:hypothetical protein L6452_00634 [Arctium lappa]|uniref:Uncharacterized protein n=1 Tax=Arctium lappa TaxID=4217 RepID=A0ACB9FF28_ARCLA|nr:hypothetical protein L6452_00634 [Arctium lappa]